MITTLGRNHIRSYLAGLVPSIGQSIAIGTDPTPVSATDTKMGFETMRVQVSSISLDPVTDKIIFKGTVENTDGVQIHEVGLWSSNNDRDSSVVISFDDEGEWAGGTEYTGSALDHHSRIGSSGLPVFSGDTVEAFSNDSDLTGMLGPDDEWTLAQSSVASAPASTIKLRVMSVDNSYIEFSFSFPSSSSAEYAFSTQKVKNATTYGAFDSARIEGLQLTFVSDATPRWTFIDGVVANNAPAEREGSVLVARSVISPSFKTDPSGSCDVEYELGVIV